jgi:CRISPR-associated protein Cas6
MGETTNWSWQESEEQKQPAQSARVVDLSFKLACQCLHVDHTAALFESITSALPWFSQEALAGLHLVHVAGSQNGWMRPEEPDELLYLSKRTRLTIRIPQERIQDAHELTGQTLDIAGNQMEIGKATEKPVLATDILFSRHVIAHDEDDENKFLSAVAAELRELGVGFKKLLPGKQVNLRGPEGIVKTRSLMVADLDKADSLILQEQGIGEGRTYGCGIFIHHKGIKAVKPNDAN